MIEVRQAVAGDAQGMCAVINPLIAAGGTTAHRTPFDATRITAHYIAAARKVSCVVALLDGEVVGFQSLARAPSDWAAPDGRPSGWGIIASFVSGAAHGQGIGRKMFAETVPAARAGGLVAIDATIRRENTIGLGFYSRIGFVDYGSDAERLCKRYDL